VINAATKSADDTRELAAAIAPIVRGGDVLLLAGDLGAGKTTFAQGFGRALGVEEPVTSPTFTLMRTYHGSLRVVHCDLYRLDHLQEIIDLGIIELVDDDGIALIEWGDIAEAVLPNDFLEIRIAYGDASPGSDEGAGDARMGGDDERSWQVRPVGSSWSTRAVALQRALERWSR
jgi:tRNA threonylcarbamoyladenosine biosynthesis protein TsaE